MSAYRFVTLTCDSCGEVSDLQALTVPEARRMAKAHGWTREGAGDMCGICRGTHRRNVMGGADERKESPDAR